MPFKLIFPIIIFFVTIWTSNHIVDKLTFRLDFTKAFQTTPLPAPSPQSEGVSMEIKGTGGDKMVFGVSVPGAVNVSEKLSSTPIKIEEIKLLLEDNLDIERWESITKLPAVIFDFDVYLYNKSKLESKTKDISNFLIFKEDDEEIKIFPGQEEVIIEESRLDDIPSRISKLNISLEYKNGMYQNFYDKEGNLVSQASGELVIRPALMSKFFVLIGVWAFVIAILLLLKQTIFIGRDFAKKTNG